MLATVPQTLNDSVFKAKPDNKKGMSATVPDIQNEGVYEAKHKFI